MLRYRLAQITILGLTASLLASSAASAQTVADYHKDDLMRHIMFFCHPDLKGRMTGSEGERKAIAYVADRFAALQLKPYGDVDENGNRSWFQKFQYPAGAVVGDDCQLVAENTTYQIDRDWRPITFSRAGQFDPAEVVFAGYGILAEQDGEQKEYNSFVHLDVKDKWVMVFRHMPEDVADERRQFLTMKSSLQRKAMNLRDMGALGMIVVSGPNSHFKDKLIPLGNSFSRGQTSLGAISISDELAAAWLKMSGKDLKEIQTRLDQGDNMMGFVIPGLKLDVHVDVKQNRGTGHNVVGRLQVGEQPSQQVIVIGAHIDHLGEGRNSSSRATSDEKTLIHFGADDNASGVAAMMEIAEFTADLVSRDQANGLQRDLVFAGWSGEELGLHGSKHFVNQLLEQNRQTPLATRQVDPAAVADAHNISLDTVSGMIENLSQNHSGMSPDEIRSVVNELKLMARLMENGVAEFDRQIELTEDEAQLAEFKKQKKHLTNTLAEAKAVFEMAEKHGGSPSGSNGPAGASIYPNVAAYLNMDMVGRYRDQLVLQGLGSSEQWGGLIEKASFRSGLNIKKELDTNLPTDATNFYKAGVPILAAFTKSHTEYHTPRDTPEKINSTDATRIAKMVGKIAVSLSTAEQPLEFQQYDRAETMRSGGVMGIVYLGTHPDYGFEGTGIRLTGVTLNSPAQKAGLQNGDIIVALGGRKIENMDQYMIGIGGLKVGRETSVVIMRGERQMTLKIVPGVKE